MLQQRSKHPREMVITPKASTSLCPILNPRLGETKSAGEEYRRAIGLARLFVFRDTVTPVVCPILNPRLGETKSAGEEYRRAIGLARTDEEAHGALFNLGNLLRRSEAYGRAGLGFVALWP